MFIKRSLVFILILHIWNSASAQLCQGSLGDPVVNITFGTGPNTGPALSSSINNYQYINNFCPGDGYYTIANSTNNCFGNSWLTLNEDHTPGDVNGYMFLVNASYEAGDFYVQQVDGLCGDVTYEFAAWIINVIRQEACGGNSNQPNLTFSIETTTGTVLQTYNTGDIPPNNFLVWKQHGLYFSTPLNTTSVVVRITNNAPGGCGNDLALDDITFRPCGPKILINVDGLGANKDVCIGDNSSYTFTTAIVGGNGNTFYQWQKSTDSISWTDIAGANTSSYTNPAISTIGKYYFRLAVAKGNNIFIPSCRIASDVATVSVNNLPVPFAANNGPTCEGKDVIFNAFGGGTYAWAGPNNFSSNIQSPVLTNVLLSDTGKYYVTVTSPKGCIQNDSTIVVINRNPSADAGIDATICEGTNTQLQGSGINATGFNWSPATGLSNSTIPDPVASPGSTTLYMLVVNDGVCKDSASVLVTILKIPTANAGPDKVVIGNQPATLEGSVTGQNITYSWSPDLYLSSDTSLTPQVLPPFDTSYMLIAVSNDGCGSAMDNVLVKYFKEIYIPNAFTPNNDGVNDRWNIPPLPAFPGTEVSVYNRFGQLVFFSKGNTKQWDGTSKGALQPPGVYTYIVDLKTRYRKLHGVITLIR